MKFYIPIVTVFLINSVASEICYAGGMKDHPISANTEQPPCWYKSHDGTYSCYNFIFGGLCPFVNSLRPFDTTLDMAAKKPETVNLDAKKPESVNLEAKEPESMNLEAKEPETVNLEAKTLESMRAAAKKPRARRPMVCFRGNMKSNPVPARMSPPCWYREKDGSFSCYEFDPTTKKCPGFPNRVKRPLF